MKTIALLVASLALGATGLAKDELIPTDKRSQNRQQKPPNPLDNVAGEMYSSARRLEKAQTDETTQDIQDRIIEQLEKLIEAARQQQQQQQQQNQSQAKRRQQRASQPQPSAGQQQQKKPIQQQTQQPAQKPGVGPAGRGKSEGPIHTDAQEWGNLPPAIRDQLLQTQGEGFPLKYRELLRRYYRDLAQPEE
jgi:TolA-binding protein